MAKKYDIYSRGRKLGTARQQNDSLSEAGGCVLFLLIIAVIFIVVPVALSFIAPFFTTIPQKIKNKIERRLIGRFFGLLILSSPLAYLIVYGSSRCYYLLNGQLVFENSPQADFTCDNVLYGLADGLESMPWAITLIVVGIIYTIGMSVIFWKTGWFRDSWDGLKIFMSAYVAGWLDFWRWIKKKLFEDEPANLEYYLKNVDKERFRRLLVEYDQVNGNMLVQEALATQIDLELQHMDVPAELVPDLLARIAENG